MAYYTWKSYKLGLGPLDILSALRGQTDVFLLDSSLNSAALGRYSFLGFAPFHTLETKGQNPFEKLRKLLDTYKITVPKAKIPFLGGAVGFLSYDLGFILEKCAGLRPKVDSGIPECRFGFYNTVIIIDHLRENLDIFCVGFPEKGYHLQRALAEYNLKETSRMLTKIIRQEPFKIMASLRPLKSNFNFRQYLQAVRKAKEYIRNGDIYQVNLSQEFSAKTERSAFEIYRRLRRLSPTHFGAYLDAGDFQIISSSPERFLSLRGSLVTTRPMKGTRPRSRVKAKDSELKKALLASPKDKAELMMIVDLERNDLGRVCTYNTIKADELRNIEAYSTVFQTTATISGRLHKEKDRLDLLNACFPGGSITGVPKIRAMQIIEELEPHRRGIYTGSLGYLSFSGDMDFNILIRTILKNNDTIKFGVGGGIVADSLPEDEYEETMVKARAMMEALS
ncbi:MAG: aminodeoxychorismate synthase component I [Candidatus Omnitrophota bacterium]